MVTSDTHHLPSFSGSMDCDLERIILEQRPIAVCWIISAKSDTPSEGLLISSR